MGENFSHLKNPLAGDIAQLVMSLLSLCEALGMMACVYYNPSTCQVDQKFKVMLGYIGIYETLSQTKPKQPFHSKCSEI